MTAPRMRSTEQIVAAHARNVRAMLQAPQRLVGKAG